MPVSCIVMIPKKLQRGDTVGIVSPSAPVTEDVRTRFEKGVEFLNTCGFEVKVARNALKNTLGYSATPREKADDINSMFEDAGVNAIICSQGGSNANTVLPLLNFDAIKNNPKIFLGISDITVLLNAIYKETGLITFHGNDVIWGFGGDYTEYDVHEFKQRLVEGTIGEIPHNSKWKCIKEGVAEGVLVGGNLNCMNKLAGTQYLPHFKDTILFLESFGKKSTPAHVECELHRLRQMGVFKQIKGMWIGYYNHESNISYEDIVINAVKEYEFPVLKCDDFGHNTPNTTIPIGCKVTLDATNQRVVLQNDCVK